MARKCALMLLLLCSLFLAGCWSKKEIENLAIVSAIGVDYVEVDGEPKWQVTMEVYHPRALAPSVGNGSSGGGSGTQPISWIVSSLGDTVDEAINHVSARTSRVLFFAHTRLVIVGKEAVEKFNLEEVLSLFFSSQEARLRNWLLIADGKAQEVLLAGPEMEPTRAGELEEMILQTRKRLSKAEVLNFREVGESLALPGKDVITGRVEVFKSPEPPTSRYVPGQESVRYTCRLSGAAVFSEGNFAGWFTDLETRGYLFTVGKAQMTIVPLHLTHDHLFDANVRIIKAKSRITPEINGGDLKMKVAVWAEGHLEGFFPGDFEVTPRFFEEVGRQTALELEKDILAALNKAKEYRADIFGFGEKVYRWHPGYWQLVKEDWRDYFANLPVEVEVEVVIRRTGIFEEPVPSR